MHQFEHSRILWPCSETIHIQRPKIRKALLSIDVSQNFSLRLPIHCYYKDPGVSLPLKLGKDKQEWCKTSWRDHAVTHSNASTSGKTTGTLKSLSSLILSPRSIYCQSHLAKGEVVL